MLFRLFYYLKWRISFSKRAKESKIRKKIKFKQIRDNNQQNFDICLLGDSLIEYWTIKTILDRKCFNAGVGDATTEDVLEQLNNDLLNGTFKIIILILGTNDVKYKYTLQQTVENLLRIFAVLYKKYPDSKIIYFQIPPVNGRWDRTNFKIEELNTTILSKLPSYITTFKLEILKNLKGKLDNRYTYDGLHFNQQAYKLIEKKLISIL